MAAFLAVGYDSISMTKARFYETFGYWMVDIHYVTRTHSWLLQNLQG